MLFFLNFQFFSRGKKKIGIRVVFHFFSSPFFFNNQLLPVKLETLHYSYTTHNNEFVSQSCSLFLWDTVQQGNVLLFFMCFFLFSIKNADEWYTWTALHPVWMWHTVLTQDRYTSKRSFTLSVTVQGNRSNIRSMHHIKSVAYWQPKWRLSSYWSTKLFDLSISDELNVGDSVLDSKVFISQLLKARTELSWPTLTLPQVCTRASGTLPPCRIMVGKSHFK